MATVSVGKGPLSKNRMVRPIELEPIRAEMERPSTVRLTAIIAVCFSLGVAWPLLGGRDFVQRPPGSNAKPLDIDSVPGEADPSGPNSGVAPEIPAARAAPLLAARQTASVEGHTILSCHGDRGEAVSRCDEPNVAGRIEDPIARLADCDAAAGISGVLSLGVHLDFSLGRVTTVKAGQSTTLPKSTTARLIACAETTVVGTPLEDVEHEHGRYWLYYRVSFQPPAGPLEPAQTPSGQVVRASGQATIGWTTAVVHESASPRARVVARLSHGTRVNVTGRMGDWYRIEHLGKTLGWIHRQGIGM